MHPSLKSNIHNLTSPNPKMELTVECQKREAGSKPNALRRSGLIPAVLYGHQGAESVTLTLNAKVAERLLDKASVNNTVIELNVSDMGWSGKTLLREVQAHPWKGYPYHLSFFAIASQGSIDVEVPLHFVGEAYGVKTENCILDPTLTSLEVRCAPDSIPESIEIDVSGLHRGDALHVRDLALPSGVTAITDAERIVVSIVTPQAISETEATASA
jgi:large subunit ribosomal protein L25